MSKRSKNKSKSQNELNGGRADDLFGRSTDLNDNRQSLFDDKKDDLRSTFSTTTLQEGGAFSAMTSSAGTAGAAVAASTFGAGSIMEVHFY